MTHVVLDLSKQRLFIHPDAPLPRFNPRPKAVMVTPVYDYDGYIKTPVERGRSQDRDTIFTNAFNAAQHVISNQPQRPGKLNRRYSSHSPSRRYSESPGGYSDDRYSTYSYIAPEVGFGQGVSTDRARPPDHHLAQKPPSYQIQATQGHAQSQQYGYSYPSSNRPTHSQYQQSYAPAPIIQAPSHGGTHNTGGGGRKSRPSNHHLVQNPPQHQTQATQAAQIYGPAQPPPAAVSMSHSHSGGPIRPGRLDKLILEYFKIIPPNPEWCLSRCSGRKRAVCIGINYIGQRDALKGCANDARHMRDFLIQHHNFPPSEILLLTDDDQRNKLPTHKSIFEACMWLVNGAKRDDSLFFHYSGHGGQSPDAEGRETDGMDEVIFPLDHSADPSKPLDIIDDELHQALVLPLPAGCRLTAIFDSCHSGTVLDLPYIHSAHGRLRNINHVSKRARGRKIAPKGDVLCFAACRDDEKSADTFHGGVAVGAMSYALIKSLEQNQRQTYEELLTHLRDILIPKYGQKAQISGSHPLELDREFSL